MIRSLLILPFLAVFAHSAPPAVGTTSDIITFEKLLDPGVENSGLNDHEGKIVILTYFTPW